MDAEHVEVDSFFGDEVAAENADIKVVDVTDQNWMPLKPTENYVIMDTEPDDDDCSE